jgi:LysR family transcriptional regulator, glycine cleavage system transcriptional activator
MTKTKPSETVNSAKRTFVSTSRQRLPPLFSLQAFEAAARLGSFSLAATELHITQSAVSKQIKQLEQWCDSVLFLRRGPKIELTPSAHELLQKLSAPLHALHTAVYGAENVQSLQINTLASSARAWLLPRIQSFQQQHPDISLSIQSDYALINPPPNSAIVALRFGHPPAKQFYSELLFADALVCVAHPKLVKSLGSDASRWPAESILQHSTQDFGLWLDHTPHRRSTAPSGAAFNDASLLLDAAEAGLGVAMSRLSIALPRLQAKQLILASPKIVACSQSNYLVCRKDCVSLPAVQAFGSWMRAQAKKIDAQLRQFLASQKR